MTSNRRRIAAKRKNKDAGSSENGEPVFLVVGRLQRPHGLRGEILMGIMTDFPERIKIGTTLYVGEDHQPHQIVTQRNHNAGLLLKFNEYQNREDVGLLRNNYVYVRADDRPPLPDGEYYHHQLIGLKVVTEDDNCLGHIKEILETGSNDVYIIRSEKGKEILLPAIEEVVLAIDLDAREIRVHLMEGLG